jgi:hypothetical protein
MADPLADMDVMASSSDEETSFGNHGDCEGQPYQPSCWRQKLVKTVSEREEVTARVVRIAAQCQERQSSDDSSRIASISGGATSSTAPAAVADPFVDVIAQGLAPLRPRVATDPEATAIIFDWDDTLFPTWYVTQVVRPALEKSTGITSSRRNMFLPAGYSEIFKEHSRKVELLLRTARAVGRVGIVTLSQRPWVLFSAKRFLIGMDIGKLLKELQIPIVYAREGVRRSMVCLAESEEGIDVFAIAKQRAMAKALTKLYGRDLSAWRNVISIGDSCVEKDAMKELLWSIDLPESSIGPPACKTVKLMEEPSLQQLGAELLLLKMWLPRMATHVEDFDIIMDGSEKTMLSMHEQFCSQFAVRSVI